MKASIPWQIATVVGIKAETSKAKTFKLELPDWKPHLPGQHYSLRLTAEDGYTAMRSYSIATGLGQQGYVEFTIDKVPNGEVSEFMHDILEIGDQLEVRGPIGGYFVWKPTLKKKLFLVGGGSGIVPLMSIIRSQAGKQDVSLLYSAQAAELAIYKEELDTLAQQSWFHLHYTFTRSQPDGWAGYARRVDEQMLSEVRETGDLSNCLAYVCGPTAFVEFVANALSATGLPGAFIRTERFGPSPGEA